MTSIQRFPIYKMTFKSPGGLSDVITFLSPGETSHIGGLPPEAIVGKQRSPSTDNIPSNFIPNRAFVDFLHALIAEVVPGIADYVESASRQGSGWLHVEDARASEDDPETARTDVIGGFQILDGILQVGSYVSHPDHRILTRHGFLAPHPEIQNRLLAVMRALPLSDPVAVSEIGAGGDKTRTGQQPLLSPVLAERHNKLYEEASRLLEGEILLDRKPKPPLLGWLGKRRLLKAIRLYQEALDLDPANWKAKLLVGKIHQRLGDASAALRWFLAALEQAPTNRSAAKEAGSIAISTGNAVLAVQVLQKAAPHNPGDAALWYNLGTAYLLSARASLARAAYEAALALEPDYPFTARLLRLATDVESGRRECPRTESEIARAI